MLKTLIHRPIAVTMALTAAIVLGLLALQKMPVSLMPDIDIPRISVQVSVPGAAATEMEHTYMTPLRRALSQVSALKDIESVARMDGGTVTLTFEPGSDMSLLFIAVGEQIDRVMADMPRDMERPRVMKASATDVPAFYVDVYLKDAARRGDLAFAQLGRFVRGVVSRRIEQLPQTAMVDISGTTGTQIVVTPHSDRLAALGMGESDIEQAIESNNIALEALSVRDGIYRYNIHFDSQLQTRDDVADIYLRHDDRLLQLKDLCSIDEQAAQRGGIVRHDGHDAVTMAVVKQSDARMADLQASMSQLIDDMRKEYPDIEFSVTRDQTQLLAYTMHNLEGNLLMAALLSFAVIMAFMRRWRLSLLIALSVPLSLVITLLALYLCGASLNIVSMSGLILGVGMMVDNSIIVLDNILQRWRGGSTLARATVEGTREVVGPMLSSVLTTCSVFVPLVFISGTAGALFYDQAMGVTFALFASLLVSVVVLPVYLYACYRKRDGTHGGMHAETVVMGSAPAWLCRPYEAIMRRVLRHGRLCMGICALTVPLGVLLCIVMGKERMPQVEQQDTLMSIDWNSGITADESARRTDWLLHELGCAVETSTAMAGTQEFVLSHTPDITADEAVVYLRCRSQDTLAAVKARAVDVLRRKWPEASVAYGHVGNVYDLMFDTDEADLNIRLQTRSGHRPGIAATRAFVNGLLARFPKLDIMPVPTETVVRCMADPEQMAAYKVSYGTLHDRLQALAGGNRLFDINDGSRSVPVLIAHGDGTLGTLLDNTVVNGDGTEIPLSCLVKPVRSEGYKRLAASDIGPYCNISVNGTDHDVRRVTAYVDSLAERPHSDLAATYMGGYYSSRDLIGQLAVVLAVALTLLYLILAAQFESLWQPAVILAEMAVDLFCVLLVLWLTGETLNVMSMIGIVVMSGIIINDSILKIDTINRMRRAGCPLVKAVWLAGHKRLLPIVMTSLTTILALVPFLTKGSMGAALQYPLSLTLVVGMTVGTLVSLFVVPLLYMGMLTSRRVDK